MKDFTWVQMLIGSAVTVGTAIIIFWLKRLLVVPRKVDRLEIKVDRLEERIDSVQREQQEQKGMIQKMAQGVQAIREALVEKKIIPPAVMSESPLKASERGLEILSKNNIEEFLSNCPLVQNAEKFKEMEELDIYLECFKWVEENAVRKIAEIRYNDTLSQEECCQLLAVAIRDKIFEKINYSR